MPRRALRGAVLVCALAGCLVTHAIAASTPPVPGNFVGVTVDGPLYPETAGGINLQQQFRTMEQSGVESVRVVFDWSYAQPYPSWSKVPSAVAHDYTDAGGLPTNFSQIDQIVTLAAADGISVFPTVIYAPAWDVVPHTDESFGRPARDQPYASFLTDLIKRYGPHGTFWKGKSHPMPIRRWQIWNEPNVPLFWPKQPFAATYVALLKAAHTAIKRADPGATTILAGMPNYSWKALARIYAIKGARAAFDEVAVHPYTAKPAGVITILQLVRQVMDKNGDKSKPMIADEVSWTSALGKTPHTVGLDIDTTEAGQAKRIAALLPLLARDRQALGLTGFYYYDWASDEIKNGLPFAYAGLLKYSDGAISTKPAYAAFEHAALAMEHCRRMSSTAGVCAKKS